MQKLTREITEHSDKLRYYAYNLTKNDEEANDLTQETMYKALKNKEKYVDKKNLQWWLFTIMKNTFINQYRRKKYRQKLLEDSKNLKKPELLKVDSEINLDMYMIRSDIRNAIMKLDGKYRIPFILFYKAYKYTEIAERLDLPLGTVKSRIYFARKMLMNELKSLYWCIRKWFPQWYAFPPCGFCNVHKIRTFGRGACVSFMFFALLQLNSNKWV
jgi:RNA polymerase sigma-70 factor (ECF subfamily)